jgi:hypothetical protein
MTECLPWVWARTTSHRQMKGCLLSCICVLEFHYNKVCVFWGELKLIDPVE